MLRHTKVVLALLSAAAIAQSAARATDAPAPPNAASPPASGNAATAAPLSQQQVEEIRDTVINLLNALVQRGVITREQAQAMVADAQAKAEATAKAQAQQEASEQQQAIRVPYVPQIVKDEISKQIESEIKPNVVQDVVRQAKSEGWGIPGALPSWLSHVRVFGDVAFRFQNDSFSRDNVTDYWLDYNSINSAGGITQAGQNAFLNVSIPQNRLRVRLHLGLEGDLTSWLTAVIRLGSGNPSNPVSEWQTLGQGGARYSIAIDQAFIQAQLHDSKAFPWFTAVVGRMPDPFLTPTNLIYYQDLMFEGAATTGRLAFGEGGVDRSYLFGTIGGFPILHVPLDPKGDKWLLAGQAGVNWRIEGDQRLALAGAYYDFRNISGQLNPVGLTFYNFTQPPYIQFGNTYFNIENNPANPTSQLFALAAEFRLVNGALHYQLPVWHHFFGINYDWVRNVGYNVQDVYNRSGILQAKRNTGSQEELAFGDPLVRSPWAWRVIVGYRYLQRDAVMDGWTDSDFHLGGTNARGYYIAGELGIATNAWVRLRYWGSDVIDGPQYVDDSVQLDVNARF